jgi:hypothetical protein
VIEQRDDDAVIAAIREELFRLRAWHQDVGPLEAISVGDRGMATPCYRAQRDGVLPSTTSDPRPRSLCVCAVCPTAAGRRRFGRSSGAATEPCGAREESGSAPHTHHKLTTRHSSAALEGPEMACLCDGRRWDRTTDLPRVKPKAASATHHEVLRTSITPRAAEVVRVLR